MYVPSLPYVRLRRANLALFAFFAINSLACAEELSQLSDLAKFARGNTEAICAVASSFEQIFAQASEASCPLSGPDMKISTYSQDLVAVAVSNQASSEGDTPLVPGNNLAARPETAKFGFLTRIPVNLAKKTASLASHISDRFQIDESVSERVVAAAVDVGNRVRLPATLILAVIAVESEFKVNAKNGNATGLMQIIPFWHRDKVNAIGGPKELVKIEKNIETGGQILREYLDRSKGNLLNGIRRYNASPHADAYARKVLKEQEKLEAVLKSPYRVEMK